MLRMIFTLGLALVSLNSMTVSAKSNTAPKVHYNINISDPKSHYAEVTMRIEELTAGNIDVYMPVWT
ncbi:MAG: peptidase M61, partial [Bacteroidia bacterium]